MDKLVSTEWLAARLGSDDIIVLDATMHLPDSLRDARAEFGAAHIPGARFLDLDSFTDAASDVFGAVAGGNPDHREFAFWYAQLLAGQGRHDEARATIAVAFEGEDGERWGELLRRLPATGRIDQAVVDVLLG